MAYPVVPVEPALGNLTIGGTTSITPGDNIALAGTMPSVQMVQTGTGLVSPSRAVTEFVQLKAQSVTAGTPVSVKTPASGKKFRILSYAVSLSVAGSVLFEDTTGTEVLRTPLMAAGVGLSSPEMGEGYLSSAANNALFIDVTASGTVSGWIGLCEE